MSRLVEDTPFVTRLVVRDRVISTNDEVRTLAAEGAPAGTVVVAEEQSAGRGRLGRSWHSPPGLGAYVSVLLRPRTPARELARWTLIAAVAVCEVCRRFADGPARIKWPNDVVWKGRKLAGVLAEARVTGGRPAELILGAGINLFHEDGDFPAEIRPGAVSLRQACRSADFEREEIVASYLEALGELAIRLERGGWRDIAQHWECLAVGAVGWRVRVQDGSPGRAKSQGYEGVTQGIDDCGALRVRRDDGRVEAVQTAGTVQVLEAGPCC